MAKCLGIIFDGVVYDVAFISDFGGLGTVIRSNLVRSGSNNYASQFKKYEKKANNELKKIKETFVQQ